MALLARPFDDIASGDRISKHIATILDFNQLREGPSSESEGLIQLKKREASLKMTRSIVNSIGLQDRTQTCIYVVVSLCALDDAFACDDYYLISLVAIFFCLKLFGDFGPRPKWIKYLGETFTEIPSRQLLISEFKLLRFLKWDFLAKPSIAEYVDAFSVVLSPLFLLGSTERRLSFEFFLILWIHEHPQDFCSASASVAALAFSSESGLSSLLDADVILNKFLPSIYSLNLGYKSHKAKEYYTRLQLRYAQDTSTIFEDFSIAN